MAFEITLGFTRKKFHANNIIRGVIKLARAREVWGKGNTSFFCGAFCEAKYKFRQRPKRGRGGREGVGEFRLTRAKARQQAVKQSQ